MHILRAFSPHPTLHRRIILLGTPLLLGILELGHPLLDHDQPIRMLAPIVIWWILLHVLLIPLFILMGMAFFLLLEGMHSRAATVSRTATIVYVAFTIGYDTAVGLSGGVLADHALALPGVQQAVIQRALQALFLNPAITLSYGVLFVAGIVAVCTAAWVFWRSGVPLVPVLVLLGAVFAVYSHATPFGPIGETFFFLAAGWIEFVWRKRSEQARTTI